MKTRTSSAYHVTKNPLFQKFVAGPRDIFEECSRDKLEEKNGLEWKRIQGAVKFLKEQLVR